MNLMPGQSIPTDQAGQFDLMNRYLHPQDLPTDGDMPALPPDLNIADPLNDADPRNWNRPTGNGVGDPLTLRSLLRSGAPDGGTADNPDASRVTGNPDSMRQVAAVPNARNFSYFGAASGDPQGARGTPITTGQDTRPTAIQPTTEPPPADPTTPPSGGLPGASPTGGLDLSSFGGFEPGALTLASLLSSKQPKSWLQPGAGYGDIGFNGAPTGRTSYWNEAGRPFQYGSDKEAYWYNVGNRDWQKGNLAGEVSQVDALPWAQVPWTENKWQTPTGQGGDLNYFNAEGKPFGPGDQNSYWFNKGSNQWETGDLSGKVGAAGGLPWNGGGGNQTTGDLLNLAGLLKLNPPAANSTTPTGGNNNVDSSGNWTGNWWEEPKLVADQKAKGIWKPRDDKGNIIP